MKIAVSAESTIDLTKELLKKFDIRTVPFTVLLGNDVELDGEFPTTRIFDYVNQSGKTAKTSAVNEFQFKEHFDNLFAEGYDAIVHFSLSSDMSSAYNNAVTAAGNNYNKKIFVIDSRSLSTGIALQAIYARKLANNGASAKEIHEKCLKRVPFVQASFELHRLDYLYKGGRCSFIQLFGANLFKIRPQILVKDGKMIIGSKYRGNMDLVVNKYVDDVLIKFNNPDKENVFITYSSCDDKKILENVTQRLTEAGFKNIYQTTAGGTIASHCGENCLGVLYINDGGGEQ